MKISFWTPLFFENGPEGCSLPVREKVLNVISQYFSLRQREIFQVKPPENKEEPFVRTGLFTKIENTSMVVTVLKIVSYVTIIIPVIVFIARFILRYPYDLKEQRFKESAIFSSSQIISDRKDEKVGFPRFPSIFSRGGSRISFFEEEESSTESPFEERVPSQVIKDVSEKDDKIVSKQSTEEELLIFSEEMVVPSVSHPWVYSKMPPLAEEIKNPVNPNKLNERAVKTALTELCKTLSKRKVPINAWATGFSQECLFFRLKGFPGIRFKVVKDEFYAPLSKNLEKIKPENPEQMLLTLYNKVEQMKKDMEEYSNEYSHLYFPAYKLFQSKQGRYFLAEEIVSFYQAHEAYLVWKIQDIALRPAFKELAAFINQTGLCDNITPAVCSPYYKEDRWVLVLKDVSHSKEVHSADSSKPKKGIEQLIKGLYSQESMLEVLTEVTADQQEKMKAVIKEREKTLASFLFHEKFHQSQGDNNPYEKFTTDAIQLDTEVLNSLEGFDLSEVITLDTGQTVSMQSVVEELIHYFNNLLKTKAGISCLFYHHILFNPAANVKSLSKGIGHFGLQKEASLDLRSLWIRRILNAFQACGVIASWDVCLDEGEVTESWKSKLSIWV